MSRVRTELGQRLTTVYTLLLYYCTSNSKPAEMCAEYGGIPAGGTCCLEACGTCGGTGCVQRNNGDGDDNCCVSDIIAANNVCGIDGQDAPCVLEEDTFTEGDNDNDDATDDGESL